MIDKREECLCIVSIDDFGWDEIRGWSEDEWLENATRRGWVYDSLMGYQRDGRNYFTITLLTPTGECRFREHGRVSTKNRENYVKLPEYLF